MESSTARCVRFGPYELDLRAGELRTNGETRLLPDQAFHVLCILVEHDGDIATREEIKKRLWPNDTVVEFDHSINAAIKKLRMLLEDSAESPRYIETIPRRGYRLMARVERLKDEAPPQPASDSSDSDSIDASAQKTRVGRLTGKTVSHYRVLEVIGGGGMGLVYRAEDLKLGRAVALKFLPEEFGDDARARERFQREAHAVSALDHPNICTVYEFDEYQGHPFIAMQLLQGETLREHIAAGRFRLSEPEGLEIATQIASGLAAAHERGIIHRDIKPANIFITEKKVAKILDFGVAKMMEAGEQAETPSDQSDSAQAGPTRLQLTRTGLKLGTAGYMSPEQVRGEALDARTDIFSFGVVLYEMATGERAFTGETEAILHNAILAHDPQLISQFTPEIWPKLESIIGKCLRKVPEQRYQSTVELHHDLENAEDRPRPVLAKQIRTGTWIWLVFVCGLIGTVATWWLKWGLRERLTLKADDTVVVADFINNTGDPVFDDALPVPFNQGLQQTPFLTLLAADKRREALKSLNQPTGAKLTPDSARDVCVRTNSRATIVGSIADAGNHYLIVLRASDCHDANQTSEVVRQVVNRNEIVRILGAGELQLRQDLGEPQASLLKFNQPLDVATSASLEALQSLTWGGKSTDGQAVAHFNRAIALDPDFAMAYGGLGQVAADPDLSNESITKAYQLRNRLIERKRFWTEARYYYQVTGETDKTLQVNQEWIQNYPNDAVPHDNRCGDLLRLGALEEAAAECQAARRLSQGNAGRLMQAEVAIGQLEDAKRTFDEEEAHGRDGNLVLRYYIAFLERDSGEMQKQMARTVGKPELEMFFNGLASDVEGYFGHLEKSRKLVLRAFGGTRQHRMGQEEGLPEAWTALESLREAEVGNTIRAHEIALKALKLKQSRDAGATLRDGEVMAALTLSRTGDTTNAQLVADRLNLECPLDTLVQRYWLPTVRAAIELDHGRLDNAVEELKTTLPYDRAQPPGVPPNMYPVYLRGLAYLRMGDGRKAAAEFQKIVDHPHVALTFVTGALSYLQLGRAQVMVGDKSAARKSYQDFLTLWKDADADIPIYKQAKAEYARISSQ